MADLTKEANALAMAQAANLHGLAQHLWCDQIYMDGVSRAWDQMVAENADVVAMKEGEKFVEGRTGVRDASKTEADKIMLRVAAIRDILQGKAVTIGAEVEFPNIVERLCAQVMSGRRFGQLDVMSVQ